MGQHIGQTTRQEVALPNGGPGLTQERHLVTQIPGPRSLALAQRERQAVSRSVAVSIPAYVEAAGGGIIYDSDGNSLIDFATGFGVTTIGNANPAVVDAVTKQVRRFTHTSFPTVPYVSYVEVCERLNALTPGSFDKRTALFNSGAEAIENAVKFARSATGKSAIVALDHAFHGRTNLAMSLTTKAHPYKRRFGPFAPDIYHAVGSYPYRDGLSGQAAAERTIAAIETEVDIDDIAALIVEPIQGEGGIIVPADGYLPALQTWSQKHGVIFVADEIQCGLARSGRLFASEWDGLEPDLVTTAKAIAGGLPLSAVTGRSVIMDAPQPGGIGGTFGGNPVSTAAAVAALDYIVDHDLASRARHIGDLLSAKLTKLQHDDPRVGDVRGRGAMQAIELVDPKTGAPDAALCAHVLSAATANGLVLVGAGTFGNVIRFLPPLVIDDRLIEEGTRILADIFATLH